MKYLNRLFVLTLSVSACICATSFPLAAQNRIDQILKRAPEQKTEQKDGVKRVSGTVLEAGKRETRLAFCKIFAYTMDGESAARTVTIDDGVFNLRLPDGKYTLLFECTGHKSKTFSLEVKGADVELGRVMLEVGEELEGAGIAAEPLLHRSGTRISYDVSKDPDASKISMSAMAEKIPELKLASRSGNLEFQNQRLGAILIDEEENGLINSGRQYPMEFIKAHYMKKIEIVMPGDLEYNNTAPIMLITLAKALPYGFASNLGAMSDTKNNHSPTADVVINTPLIGVGVGYSYSYAGPPALSDTTVREMSDRTAESYSSFGSTSNTHSFNANFFRRFFNDRVSFNASLRGSFSESDSFSESTANVFSPDGELLESSTTTSRGLSTSPFRLNGALRLKGDFGPMTGRRRRNDWRLEYGYNNSERTGETFFNGQGTQTSATGTIEHKVNASVNLRDVIAKPFKASTQLKGGYYNRAYTSNSAFLSESNGMDYRQQVGYFDMYLLGSAFDNKMGFMALLNNEYVGNRGTFMNGIGNTPLDYREFNVNPMLSATWSFKRVRAGLSYTLAVKRPSVSQLNPYIDRTNPYYLRTGNSELKGERNNSVSLSLGLRPFVKWIERADVKASWSGSRNAISPIVTADADGIATSSYANIGKKNSANLSCNFWLKPMKTVSTSFFASYSRTWASLPGGVDNTFDSVLASASASWTPKWFSLDATFILRPSLSSVQSAKLIMEPGGELSISRYFSKPHIGVSASVTDVFHSGGMMESLIHYDNFVERRLRERTGRTFGVHVYWRFGRFVQTESVSVNAYDM